MGYWGTAVVVRPPQTPTREEHAMGGAHRTASPPALLALTEKLRENGRGRGIDTSAGLLFNHTFWARDRVLTALDLLDRASQPATETVLALAALQGTRRTVRSEEEPGRIHSEQRNLFGWRAPLGSSSCSGSACRASGAARRPVTPPTSRRLDAAVHHPRGRAGRPRAGHPRCHGDAQGRARGHRARQCCRGVRLDRGTRERRRPRLARAVEHPGPAAGLEGRPDLELR